MIDELLEKYPNDIKVIIKNFPLNFHKEAMKAAKYSLAAHNQGKYKEMYHTIFENYTDLKDNEDLPLKYARELGLDINQFIKDAESTAIDSQIAMEMEELRNSGIERISVPKILVNGCEPAKRNFETLSKMIEKELNK